MENQTHLSRDFWVESMLQIADPVLRSMANGTLRKNMPIRSADVTNKEYCTYLEAFGRTVCGVAPWLDAQGLKGREKELQEEYREITRRALIRAVDPEDPERLNFETFWQRLVDAAFLAEGILRAPNTLWYELPAEAKQNLTEAMRHTRTQLPSYGNWLMFTAMVEAFLHFAGADWDCVRVDYALRKLNEWHLGDGIYSDGPYFAADYYNSYVMNPMLVDVSREFQSEKPDGNRDWPELFSAFHVRASRHASHLLRLIMPDGTYPVIGRSSAYRFGAFHALAQSALLHELPPYVKPGEVHTALSRCIDRVMRGPIFDENGWLRIGIAAEQPGIGEFYISTGSLYLCTTVFLPLGLPPEDPFWTTADRPISERIWSGEDVPADKCLEEELGLL